MPNATPQPNPSPDQNRSGAAHSGAPELNVSLNSTRSPLLAELAHEVRLRLKDCGVDSVWRLAPRDMALALLNGGSKTVNYVLPPAPELAKDCANENVQALYHSGDLDPQARVACAESNLLLFGHVLHGAVRTGVIKHSEIDEIKDTGFMVIDSSIYVEYLELLQRSAAAISNNVSRFINPGTKLIAEINTANGPSHPLGATPPLLRLTARPPGRLLVTALDTIHLEINLKDNETLLFFGSGYNSLADVERLRGIPNIPCVIHDSDPFVAAILTHHLQRRPIGNVIIDGSEMRRMNPGQTPGAMVFDTAPYLEPRAVQNVLRRFVAHAEPGRAVLSIQRADESTDGFSASDMRTAVERAGMSVVHRREVTVRGGLLAEGVGREILSTMAPQSIANLLAQQSPTRPTIKLELLGAVTPE